MDDTKATGASTGACRRLIGALAARATGKAGLLTWGNDARDPVRRRRAERPRWRRLVCTAASGALIAASAQAGTITYGYDALGRLTSSASSNGAQLSYAYDAADNRTQVSAVAPTARNRSVATLQDFNGDRHSDLLWRNGGGLFTTWQITGDAGSYQEQQNAYVNGTVTPDWQLIGTIDFNGDGASDLLWRNGGNGNFSVWNSTGGSFNINSYVDWSVTPDWNIIGIGDYDGDGRSDLIWRNTDGRWAEWRSTGTGFMQNVAGGWVDTSWKIVGEGDFNGDGKTDILWRNTDGRYSTWLSTGSGFTQDVATGSVTLDWHVVGVGDFNGDGKADILWWNSNSGVISVWSSSGTGFVQTTVLDQLADTSWRVAQVDDFNGDGKADILWRSASGPFAVWQSTGTGFTHNVIYDASVSADWSLITHQYDVV